MGARSTTCSTVRCRIRSCGPCGPCGSTRGSGRIPGGRGVGARAPECDSSSASSSSVVFCPRGASFFTGPTSRL